IPYFSEFSLKKLDVALQPPANPPVQIGHCLLWHGACVLRRRRGPLLLRALQSSFQGRLKTLFAIVAFDGCECVFSDCAPQEFIAIKLKYGPHKAVGSAGRKHFHAVTPAKLAGEQSASNARQAVRRGPEDLRWY